VLAVLWSVGLLAAAFIVPIYGSTTLVGENGPSAILVAGAPAVISAAVWFALWRRCARGGRVSGYIAWSCVALLSAFCVIALASVGLFIAPVALLLGWAALLTPTGQDRLTPQP
jgi:hypothetical protein